MANDIDMLNDIERLEKQGKKRQSSELNGIYCVKFIEFDNTWAEILKEKFEKKYNDRLNYW